MVRAIVQAVVAAVRAVYEAVKAAVEAIATAVKSAVEAAYNWAKEQVEAAGHWLGEKLTELAHFAQEAFVKFWTGPWRDILIGVAVAVLIAAVTVATGGAALPLIATVAISAGATGALRFGGEVAARRCAVAIKNDPSRAARFEQEMAGRSGDGAEWYKGVDQNETWGSTLKHGAVEGARGAVEGAISGLTAGAAGAIGGKLATSATGAILRGGAQTVTRQVVAAGTEFAIRTGVDATINMAGNLVTNTANAGIDVLTGQRTWDEAYKKRIAPSADHGRGVLAAGQLRDGRAHGARVAAGSG